MGLCGRLRKIENPFKSYAQCAQNHAQCGKRILQNTNTKQSSLLLNYVSVQVLEGTFNQSTVHTSPL